MFDYDKFFNMTPMKYYDCGGKYESPKAQEMIQNVGNKYIATQKSDGEWCRIIVNGSSTVAQSRSISKVTGQYGDKTQHIPHIIEEVSCLPDGTVVLGELCFPEINATSRDVGGILRCLPEKAIARQKTHPLVFKVFDCLAYNGTDISNAPYEYRFNTIKQAIDKLNDLRGLQYVMMCNYTLHDFEDFLADILRAGGEGIVIHSKDYAYAPGKRPAWTTLKVKKTTGELEVPVVATLEPNKYYCGEDETYWPYKIEDDDGCERAVTKPYYFGWKNGILVNHNGNDVRVASGLTDEDREWLATEEAQTLISNGKLWAVISGMEITEDSIRHPRLIRLRTEVE